jgi:hypothetical protein
LPLAFLVVKLHLILVRQTEGAPGWLQGLENRDSTRLGASYATSTGKDMSQSCFACRKGAPVHFVTWHISSVEFEFEAGPWAFDRCRRSP